MNFQNVSNRAISELWEFPPFAAISQYLLCQCPSFPRKQPSFFVLKCLLNNKCLRARLPGSNCDWGPMRGLKNTIWSALTLRKWRGSCFSVLLHNDESYYWALLEPGRLHLPTSLSLRPWGWWQRPAGKFSWLTNFIFTWYSLSTRFSRSGWTHVFLSTTNSPLSWITGCLAKKYSGDHSIASQKYLETTWWDLL